MSGHFVVWVFLNIFKLKCVQYFIDFPLASEVTVPEMRSKSKYSGEKNQQGVCWAL